MQNKRFFSTTRMVMIALFGALAGILHVAKFPLPFAFPGFLELDFSDIPLFIGTFALGPISGCLIVVVKILIKLVCLGTANAFVGEVANLLIGFGFVIPAGLIYKKLHSMKGAILALCVGSLSSVAVAILANRLILIPFYVEVMFHGSWEPLLGMMRGLFPSITEGNFYAFYLWVSVLPFNVLRCLIASLVSFFVYKAISRAIEKVNTKLSPEGSSFGKRDVIALVSVIAVVLILLLFALLRYFLWD